jgi:hypothetical protein
MIVSEINFALDKFIIWIIKEWRVHMRCVSGGSKILNNTTYARAVIDARAIGVQTMDASTMSYGVDD